MARKEVSCVHLPPPRKKTNKQKKSSFRKYCVGQKLSILHLWKVIAKFLRGGVWGSQYYLSQQSKLIGDYRASFQGVGVLNLLSIWLGRYRCCGLNFFGFQTSLIFIFICAVSITIIQDKGNFK